MNGHKVSMSEGKKEGWAGEGRVLRVLGLEEADRYLAR